MRIRITSPNLGRVATNPKNIIQTARQAEALGYHTLWVAAYVATEGAVEQVTRILAKEL